MTPQEAHDITRERLEDWTRLLNGTCATPIVLVAVTHGQHPGDIHVVVPEGLGRNDVLAALLNAMRMLQTADMPATTEPVTTPRKGGAS